MDANEMHRETHISYKIKISESQFVEDIYTKYAKKHSTSYKKTRARDLDKITV